MEQAERGTATRSQNVVHFLPRTTDALSRVITPALERVDVSEPTLQVVVITPDADTAIAVAEIVHAFTGAQGIEIVPVTSANRAARILSDRPVHAVAGPAIELQTLIGRSALKLDAVRTVVLAWLDDELTMKPEGLEALEGLFGEFPKDAARILIARHATPQVERIIEQHLRTARRITPPEAAAAEPPQIAPAAVSIQYVSVTAASRPAALRRLLDDLDPPSAAIVVRDSASEVDAVQTVRSLGYRRASDPIRVARYDAVPAVHTVILYDAPVMPTEIASASAVGPVQIVVLATPRDMVPLHEIADTLVPLTLEGPGAVARSRDSTVRQELATVLAQGIATRELLALEPLLDRYDGIEIAAAALRLLDAQRAQASTGSAPTGLRLMTSRPAEKPPRDTRGERGGEREARGERPSHGGADRGRPPRESRDRGAAPRGRDFKGPPRPDRGERSGRGAPGEKREWTARPPRDAGTDERRERNLGRGPRSGAQRDDRGQRPSGPPRRPRPFER